jgi:hypothetical protein
MDYIDTLKKYVGGKKYANKNIKTKDAVGYVTATGVSKQYKNNVDFQATAGKNNCPSDFIQLTPNWEDLGFPVGSLMKPGQSCGNENTYVQAEPPKTDFDWKFYLKQNPDLGNAGLTTEQQANNHWNTYGKQEGRLPNGTIMASMATLGKVGYIDVDTTIHTVPGTPTGDYKAFLSRSNVTGTQMADCSRPIPVLKYGVPVTFVQNNQKGSLQTSSMAFGTTSSEFFFRPPPGDDRQGQTINYGDQVCITTSSSSRTECGWWGCKVASVNSSKQMFFGPGGEKTPTFYIIPPLEHFDLMRTPMKYGFPFLLVSISTSNAAQLPKGASVNCRPGTEPPGMPAGIYRYSGNNTLNYYPTPEIASSWNPNWGSTVDINCSTYKLGDTATKLNTASLNNGDAVGCRSGKELPNGVQGGIYRYVEDNILRWYPNPTIANAWDPSWASRIKWSDCTTYKAGDPMSTTMESTPVQENIPRFAYVSNGKVVFGSLAESSGKNVFSTYYATADSSCDLNEVKKMCTGDCVGILHSPANNTWQKITPSSTYKMANTLQDFHMKEQNVNVNDASCDIGMSQFIDPTVYANYPQGDALKVGGSKQCNVAASLTPYKGDGMDTSEMASYKPSIVSLQEKQMKNTTSMKVKTNEYKEVSQGIKNTPTMDTLEQQYLDMTIFDSQNKSNLILWGVISASILAIVLIRK